MKLRHGGTPDYVPFYSLMGAPYKGESACGGIRLPFFTSTQFVDGGKDIWGVPYKAPEAGVQATMPDTSFVMLEDIADWTKVVKFPTPNDIDVEKVYQEALKTFDRSQTALKIGFDFSPFQELVAMMGFDGGLMALYTDPEEVKAMLNAMVDFLEPFYKKAFDVIRPDCWGMVDDTAAAATPSEPLISIRMTFIAIIVMLTASMETISLIPLPHAFSSAAPFHFGRTKQRLPFRRKRKYAAPTTVCTLYPMPVATAAPATPMSAIRIST